MTSQTEPSWCRTTLGDKAGSTFRWTIENFKNRPEKFKERMKSTCFKVNGPADLKTNWQLEIYPKGKTESEDYACLFLANRGKGKVKAEYKVVIIDGDGKEMEPYKTKTREYDSGANNSWGRNKWLKLERLNDRPHLLPGGNLTLKCTITVFGPQKVLSGSDSDSTNPSFSEDCHKQLSDQLGKVFSDKIFTDLKIQCDGMTFDCHKAILASRSQVFLAMFEANMKEKETNTVAIDDFKAEVVAEMLNFIYTGNVSSQDTLSEIAADLLAAANKYQLDLLKNMCEEGLCSNLKVANCVEYLVLGDMYQTFKLKRMALRLLVENVDSITDTEVIKDLFKQKPELALEVMKAVKK